MAHVELEINERKYKIACDNGQEAHLKKLGDYLEERVQELVTSIGQVGDSRLLVMASLLITDELLENNTKLEASGVGDGVAEQAERDEKLSLAIEGLAKRIERVAENLRAN